MADSLPVVQKNRRLFMGLVVYFLMFYAAWAVYEVLLDPFIKANTGFVFHLVARRLSKLIIWVAPVFLYLRYIDKTGVMAFIKADRFTRKSLIWTIIGVLVFSLRSILILIFAASPRINFNLGIDVWLGAVLLVGITEETVFRGFILEKIRQVKGFWSANVISSILFITIHFPAWYMQGTLLAPSVLFKMLSTFYISLILGYIYHKGNSILSNIICHSVNNLLVLALVS